LQAAFLAESWVARFDFYNNMQGWPESIYRSLYGPAGWYLPAFYSSRRAFRYVPNFVALAIVVLSLAILVGAAIGSARRDRRRTPPFEWTLPQSLPVESPPEVDDGDPGLLVVRRPRRRVH
jgi:hypothetical protein